MSKTTRSTHLPDAPGKAALEEENSIKEGFSMKKLTCTNGLTVSIRMSSNKYDVIVSFGHITLHPDIYMGGARLNIAMDGYCICNLTLVALYKVLIWVNSRSRKDIYKMLFSQMHCEIDPLFDLAELEAFAN